MRSLVIWTCTALLCDETWLEPWGFLNGDTLDMSLYVFGTVSMHNLLYKNTVSVSLQSSAAVQ